MPIITCTKCRGQLRFPDGVSTRRVKCPTCGNVFMSDEGADPATKASSSSPRDPTKSRDSRAEFAVDDGRSRRRDEDDRRSRRRDDDDRRSRRDDDDDRDRNRGRRRRDDDDDDRRRRRDDDDDRDRDRGRRQRDEDDDDYDRRPRRPSAATIEGQFNRASLACLLMYIGGWLQVGGAGLILFTIFLHWIGIEDGLQVFIVLAGLAGLGYWFSAATGIGFLVSGPRDYRALGYAIATAAVAGVHLMFLIVICTSKEFGPFGRPPVTHPAADVYWDGFLTQIRALPSLLFWEIGMGDYIRGIAKGSLLPIFANLIEIARLVLLFLTLRAIMLCTRDAAGAKLCMQSMIGNAIAAGGLLAVAILFGLFMLAVRPDNPTGKSESVSAVWHLYYLVLYLVVAAIAVVSTLVIRSVKGRLDYRR